MKQTWKRIGSILLALCMVCTMLPTMAWGDVGDEFTNNDLKYKVLTEDSAAKMGTVALIGYEEDAPSGSLTVTESVYSNGITYSITEIGENAFEYCWDLTTVEIPNTILSIGNDAFYDCEILESVTIGNSVKIIGERAFARTGLNSIIIPASVETICKEAFYYCDKLEDFTVNGDNGYFSVEGGVLFNKDKTILIQYPNGKAGESYSVPDSVITIGEEAFAQNENLKTASTGSINSKVETIGEKAFSGTALTEVHLSPAVKTIGEMAFSDCLSLTNINFAPGGVLEIIGDEAFFQCIDFIGSDEGLIIPDSVKTIGGNAFSYCDSLESVKIGKSVNSIGTDAFYVVHQLTSIVVDSDNAYFSAVENVLYDKGKTKLIRYLPGKEDTSFTVPDTVTEIEQSAFYSTDKLETVTIPSAVNNIGDYAFYYSDMKSIIFLGDTPPATVGRSIFDKRDNLTNIYVPEGSIDAYKSALGTDYASKVTALPTIDQAGWAALIAGNGAAINDGDIIILGEDVTGNLYRHNSLPNLTIDGNGHTINGYLNFAQKINLTLKDIAIQGPDCWQAITFDNSNEGSMLITSGTVAITGGKGKGSSFYGEAGVYSNADLTITASDETTITAGDADEESNFSQSAVWVKRGSLTLDGGSPTFQGGKGYGSYGANVGKTENPGNLIITSGSPVFKGGSINDLGIGGADVTGTIRISSAGSPQFIGADGKGDSNSRANGAWALNLEITAGTPIFKGGSASGSERDSKAGCGIEVTTTTISGTASPTFTGGNGAAQECGGDGLSFTGGLTISTSGEVVFTGGKNSDNAIREDSSWPATNTGINLKDLTGKITADNTQGRYGAIGLLEGSSITYPEGLSEARKYNGTDKTYTLDMGDETAVTGVTLNKSTLSLYSNTTPNTATLTATVAPADATDKTVTWQSSNTAVATVDANGKVTAVGNGTAVINVTTTDGGYIASCTVTVTKYSSGGSDDNGGGSSSNNSKTKPATPPTTPAPSTTGSTATTTVTTTTGADGKAAASVPATQVDNALKQAQDAAAKSGNAPKVEIKVDAPANATAVETSVPQAAMAAIASGKLQDLTISSPVANLTFDGAALNTIAGAAGDVNFSASKVDTANLPAAVQALIGNRPVYEFSVTSGGNTISQFNGNVNVAVPYRLGAGENPNAVIISFINAGGNLEVVTNGRYDAATGTVVFTTNHFSKYAIGYNKIDFTDVTDSAWYVDAVTFLAARGITGGTTETTFNPDGTLTRGQFLTLLMRAYDMAADENTENNFSDAGNTYYTGYLAAAKRLGITSGLGENKFAPEQSITRQEMFTMLYNALKALDKLPAGNSGKTLADFTDSGSVADWATEALTALTKSGIVTGSGGKLDPTVGSTRAQMAQALYNLLGM